MMRITTDLLSPLNNARMELANTVVAQKECPTLEQRARSAIRCGAVPAKFTAESTKKALCAGLHLATTSLGLASESLKSGYQCATTGANKRRQSKDAVVAPLVRETIIGLAFGGEFLAATGLALATGLKSDGENLLTDTITGAVSAGAAYGALLADPWLTPITAVVGATAYELNQLSEMGSIMEWDPAEV